MLNDTTNALAVANVNQSLRETTSKIKAVKSVITLLSFLISSAQIPAFSRHVMIICPQCNNASFDKFFFFFRLVQTYFVNNTI